ncbi:hypothetical protein [Prevotella lacticifex]|uniref:Uncharacterized protein n=1 Tax=Prevotella lacticifex TaxID=2854755 RepID=A0A9R1C8N6_9BACT|nr:hypothetical protein [Prevotella lacticifex]GJG37927.1 hypothetical protein PRLR5003_30840 [Prevotella lacticifex]GJG41117.1 hypothetical protein PRLR5019_30880 [Prevotella lacticifex]GJG43410.1 hypothetical protein PRLR5025_21960 [Prevotella lacticifex]GJG47192.1 hypothetical protein PRLR5027_27870 [Prevotella lacticifex]GJG50157.1 hypothetical protein PRLR5052_25700 [Prevotella lacticifex]
MKKNYVKPSVKVREIDMESLLASQSDPQINIVAPTNLENSPTVGGVSPGTNAVVGASQNLWSEEEE